MLQRSDHLKAMSRKEAQLAITGPITQLRNKEITFERRLLDALLDDLAYGEIELPHLQLVCSQLFSALPDNRSQILLADYEALGRTAGVLGDYLQETLDKLPGKQPSIAKGVLKSVVSR